MFALLRFGPPAVTPAPRLANPAPGSALAAAPAAPEDPPQAAPDPAPRWTLSTRVRAPELHTYADWVNDYRVASPAERASALPIGIALAKAREYGGANNLSLHLLLTDARAAVLAANPAWDTEDFDFDAVVTSNKDGTFGYAGLAFVGGKGLHLRSDHTSLRTAGVQSLSGTAGTFSPYGVQVDWQRNIYGGDGAIPLDMTPYSADQATYFGGGGSTSATIDNPDKEDAVLLVGLASGSVNVGAQADGLTLVPQFHNPASTASGNAYGRDFFAHEV